MSGPVQGDHTASRGEAAANSVEIGVVVVRRRRADHLVAADFAALGRTHPRQAARLWVAATAECR